ncbi:MAG: ATP-binding protein [Aggregatilineales bacterium]
MRLNNTKHTTAELLKLSPFTVRGRLILFILVLLIPIGVWLGLNIAQRRAFVLEQAETRIGNFTSIAAENYGQEINDGHARLARLADSFTQDSATACAGLPLLASSNFMSFAIVDMTGESVCSNVTDVPAYDPAWLDLLQANTATPQTLINQQTFTLGLVSSEQLFLTTFNLDWIGSWFATIPLPEGSRVSVLTPNGVIVSQYPPDETVIGQPFHDGGIFLRLTQDGATSASGQSSTGNESFYGQRQLDENLILMVEIPQSYIFGQVKDVFVLTIAGLGILITVIAVIAWLATNWMFVRPVQKLTSATERLANGDLSARTDLPHSIMELDRLAYTINQLAVSLQQRDDDVANYTRQLETEITGHKSTLATLEKTIHLLRTENLARLEMQKADERKLQFLGIIAHELKTPLTSIKGFARTLLATDVQWDEENQREFIGVIDDEADQLINLVEQLLDVSQIESGRLSTHRVSTGFDNILRMAQPRLEVVSAKHHLVMDVPKKLPGIYADPHRITQVIVNLVSNAAKYSPENTTITLSMKLIDDEHVQIDVTDEGVGISPKNRRILFQPFQRVYDERKRVQGAGLGLVICKGIVEAHGGEIWIADSEGKGTTFSFTLPLVPHHDDIMTTMQ